MLSNLLYFSITTFYLSLSHFSPLFETLTLGMVFFFNSLNDRGQFSKPPDISSQQVSPVRSYILEHANTQIVLILKITNLSSSLPSPLLLIYGHYSTFWALHFIDSSMFSLIFLSSFFSPFRFNYMIQNFHRFSDKTIDIFVSFSQKTLIVYQFNHLLWKIGLTIILEV